MERDRRRVLRTLTGVVAGASSLGGCLGESGTDGEPTRSGDARADDTPVDNPATDRGSPTPTPTPMPAGTPTVRDGGTANGETASADGTATDEASADATDAENARVVLERVDGTPNGTLAVYQPELRATLREAATADGVARAVASATVDNPQPVLPRFDAVELVDERGAATGVYDLTADGGTRYELPVGAERVADPDGEVTALSTLRASRREFLRSAIRDEYVSVFPETERGEWARESVFGSVFEHGGNYYRMTETTPTDAAFFSQQVWYTVTLTPVDSPEGEPVRLRLAEIPERVSAVLDPLVESGTYRRAPDRIATDPGPVPDAVESFADRTDGVLIHVGAMALGIE